MTIDKTNADIINTKDVYLHDDVLLSLDFDRSAKILRLEIKKNISLKKYVVEFINVIGFSMTACDFWGRSERICDLEFAEGSERKIVSELKKEWYATPGQEESFMYDNYIESVLVFISGDKLRIVSEKIVISD